MTPEPKKENKTPLQAMIEKGELIPTTGPSGIETANPLKDFSCEDAVKHMESFCKGELGIKSEVLLMKMEKHLKGSVSRGCGCAEKFSELIKNI